MGCGAEIFAYILNFAAGVLMIICSIMPFWKENDSENDVVQGIKMNVGLWCRCTTLNTGHWQCDEVKGLQLYIN